MNRFHAPSSSYVQRWIMNSIFEDGQSSTYRESIQYLSSPTCRVSLGVGRNVRGISLEGAPEATCTYLGFKIEPAWKTMLSKKLHWIDEEIIRRTSGRMSKDS